MEVQLKKPVSHMGVDVSTITFREPNAGDIAECGYPLVIGDSGGHPQAGSINRYIRKLGTPSLTANEVKEISPKDWQACMEVILVFFG